MCNFHIAGSKNNTSHFENFLIPDNYYTPVKTQHSVNNAKKSHLIKNNFINIKSRNNGAM